MNDPTLLEIARLWAFMQWLSGGAIAGLLLVAGHLQWRIGQIRDDMDSKLELIDRNLAILRDNVNIKFEAAAQQRHNDTEKWREEQRRYADHTAEWRTEQATQLATLATRHEVRNMLQILAKKQREEHE